MAELIERPYDPFWDVPPTRRELQKAFNKIGKNTEDLMSMVDTNCLVVNYLCEKLGVTRKDLDEYVEQKKTELAVLKKAQETQTNEQPN